MKIRHISHLLGTLYVLSLIAVRLETAGGRRCGGPCQGASGREVIQLGTMLGSRSLIAVRSSSIETACGRPCGRSSVSR